MLFILTTGVECVYYAIMYIFGSLLCAHNWVYRQKSGYNVWIPATQTIAHTLELLCIYEERIVKRIFVAVIARRLKSGKALRVKKL